MWIFSTLLLIFGVSQLYWAWRGYSFAAARIPSRARRWAVCGAVLAAYLAEYQYNLGAWREAVTPVRLTLRDALLAAPFLWWAASSLVAFLVAILFAIPRGIVGGVRRVPARRRAVGPEIQSPARRQFLERTAAEMHLVAKRAIEHLDHKDCETACYRCLKSYNNQRYHEYLAWPLVMPDLEHEFMPENVRPLAYYDRPVPIGLGQTISQPYIVALMTELAAVGRGSRVLEIGTGSGYQAAVLAELGADVYSMRSWLH